MTDRQKGSESGKLKKDDQPVKVVVQPKKEQPNVTVRDVEHIVDKRLLDLQLKQLGVVFGVFLVAFLTLLYTTRQAASEQAGSVAVRVANDAIQGPMNGLRAAEENFEKRLNQNMGIQASTRDDLYKFKRQYDAEMGEHREYLAKIRLEIESLLLKSTREVEQLDMLLVDLPEPDYIERLREILDRLKQAGKQQEEIAELLARNPGFKKLLLEKVVPSLPSNAMLLFRENIECPSEWEKAAEAEVRTLSQSDWQSNPAEIVDSSSMRPSGENQVINENTNVDFLKLRLCIQSARDA